MGLCNSPDIFQEKKNKLFNGIEYVKGYINYKIIMRDTYFEEYVIKGKIVFKKIKQLVLKSMQKNCFSPKIVYYILV